MAAHTAAFQQSIDSATLLAINTVVDDVLTRTGTTRYIVPPGLQRLYWAAALGANLTRAQTIAPSLLVRRMNPEVAPRRRGAEAFSLTGPEIWIPPRPIILVPGEEIEFQVAEDAVGASQVDGLICLGPDALPAMPDGDIRIVRATAATALVARTWTSVVLTLDSSLEAGTYVLVGFLAISATVIAARPIITGQQPRPGLPGLAGTEAAAVDFDRTYFDRLMWWNMGAFTHITVPAFQFLAAAADAAETVYLYVIRTGGAP